MLGEPRNLHFNRLRGDIYEGLSVALFIMLINATLFSGLKPEEIAFNEVSYALAGVFLVAIVLVWFAKPPFVPRRKA